MRSLLYLCTSVLVGVGSFPSARTAEPDNQAGRSHFDEAAAAIDRLIESRLHEKGVEPAELADDAEFCRRIWLDLAGVAPPVNRLREFLREEDANKHARLIDELLDSPRHARHLATRWTRMLLPASAQTDLSQAANAVALHGWLQTQFQKNVPYDYLIADFLTAGGPGNEGPAIFYTSRQLQPEKIAAASSQAFLGIQMQCAQCHDHPFDRWTQQDFWSFAAFFSQVQQKDASRQPEAIIEDHPGRQLTLPESEQIVLPRYPGVEQPPEPDPSNHRRRQLTIWLASRNNPYFARSAANRVWHHLFGRGLVHPVDHMDAANRPSHPEVLAFLENYFIDQRFDLRSLYATLTRTRAYRRTSRIDGDPPPERLFSRMLVKTLTPEQFFDTLQQNVLRRTEPNSGSDNRQTSQRRAAMRLQFVQRMHSADTEVTQYPHGVVQALSLINGPEVRRATDPNQLGLLTAIQAPFLDERQRIDTLYLATVSRLPTEEERSWIQPLLDDGKEPTRSTDSSNAPPDDGIADLLWALLNSAEFATCP